MWYSSLPLLAALDGRFLTGSEATMNCNDAAVSIFCDFVDCVVFWKGRCGGRKVMGAILEFSEMSSVIVLRILTREV